MRLYGRWLARLGVLLLCTAPASSACELVALVLNSPHDR